MHYHPVRRECGKRYKTGEGPSVHPPVRPFVPICLSRRSTAAASGGFAAEVGTWYRPIRMCNSVFVCAAKCGVNIGLLSLSTNTIRYDTRCYFNVRSKADISRLNLPHGDN